ncbi:nucleotide exchange factor GrpE [Candidatus Dojkabacteria bacterium CG_4_9_14_3_um_filter_150_Dojkabacteria_WS6_41_13]|uniref:Protein GrpE n=1 Tax=Candidatus Dojkabacteria bacterium CG_4_10_14_0_2_um_filter_Dojkabacteria_WS6_41_15 TaxID=2014249 RepID=A0A2M7W1C0_9BACT|nr:MAG: nucleotide exchange factor GrpE [Candidatus Dojkabacteria bacterium CG_4_10_14_3_um_filter_Dojkabacteria_WS6_41_9]PJA12086.1 MAG: nucleotide exchange factor GrpE [Candidatus Dojkabacteria bacterium CG_4_10_14_0_2_um_filter_Dojkabacteria_WS6_41_15]PJB22590.1 MAG: nucleotide exchange factor GrpE [Candidatus Dojkabacteria bacterium CG_4_9_14_3_um_filter_150_Dojkabacteria_WS6_41_13]
MKKNENKKTQETTEQELQLTQLTEQVVDLDTKLRTALADFQNLRKELEKQHEMRESVIKKHVFNDLIDIFSDLFFAVEQLPEELKKDSHIAGIVNIMAKYKDLLKNHGVTEISFEEGTDYDPKYAEVLGIVNHKEFDNKIAQTIQPGFRIGEVLIKPARVMIYKKDNS